MVFLFSFFFIFFGDNLTLRKPYVIFLPTLRNGFSPHFLAYFKDSFKSDTVVILEVYFCSGYFLAEIYIYYI